MKPSSDDFASSLVRPFDVSKRPPQPHTSGVPVPEALPEESANERYERFAEMFHTQTGMMAPGKDVPAAMGRDDYELRAAAWKAGWPQQLRLDARERENARHEATGVRLCKEVADLTARAEQAERERENLRGYLRWCAARGGAEPVTYGSRLPECVGGLAYYTIAPPSGCTVGPARTFEEALDAAVERYIASRGSADHA